MQRRDYTKNELKNWHKKYNDLPKQVLDKENINLALSHKINALKIKRSNFKFKEVNPAEGRLKLLEAKYQILTLPAGIAVTNQLLLTVGDEIRSIDKNIKQLNQRVANTERQMLDPCNSQSVLEQERDRLVGDLAGCENNRRDFQSQLLTASAKLIEQENLLSRCKLILGSQVVSDDVQVIKRQISELNEKISVYHAELKSTDETIAAHEKKVEQNEIEILHLKLRSEEMKDEQLQFRYFYEIAALVRDTHSIIHNVVSDYEAQFPEGQTVDARIALYELKRYSDLIIDEYAASEQEMQLQFNRLQGLVWDTVNKLHDDEISLTTKLYSDVLAPACLSKDDATAEYALFGVTRQLKMMTAQDLLDYEKQLYDTAVLDMQVQLNALPDNADYATKHFYQAANTLLSTIEKQRYRQGRLFDMKFHTTILNESAYYLTHPNDISTQKRMLTLTDKASHGKPSFARKLVGGLLMVLGAATALTGLGLGLGTFGMASPISLSLICAGAAVFASGAGLYAYGCRRGINRRMGALCDTGMKIAGPHNLFAHQAALPEPAESHDRLKVEDDCLFETNTLKAH